MKAERIADNYNADTLNPQISGVSARTIAGHDSSSRREATATPTRRQCPPIDKAEAVRLAILRTG